MMHLARNVFQGASAGLLAGASVGLAESAYLYATGGAPDLWAPAYALVLYGIIGLALGLGAGVVVTPFEKVVRLTEERASAVGAVAGFAPLAVMIAFYVVNKDVYAEQGIPLVGKLAILGVVAAISAVLLLGVPALLRGPAKLALRPGVALVPWLAAVVLAGMLAIARPADDPRSHFAAGKPVPAALADKPNVLFVMVDTLRADHLGCYGSDVHTPTIDALCADGVVFENDFSNASWTRASGASLLTSRIPAGHETATKSARLPDAVTTWAEALQPAGVTTGALVDNINLAASFGFDQGYDSFYYEAPAYRFGATESVFGLSMFKVLTKVAERVDKHKAVERFYQPADVVLGDAEKFIDANKDGRWALYVHLMEPHDPYFEHPNLEGKGDAEYDGVGFARAEVERPDPAQKDQIHALYRGEVAFLDTKLAPFVKWLKDNGHYDDTMIVFTADHGEEFAEHGGFWHGTTLYDEQIHVPLIVKLPKQKDAGTRIPWQVREIDVAPTIATALGIAIDPSWCWQGKDLLADVDAWLQAKVLVDQAASSGMAPPSADGTPAPVPTMPALDRPVVAEEDFEGNQISALRKDGFKVISANAGNPRGLPEEALFEVTTDPGEQANLAGTGKQIDGIYVEDRQKQLTQERADAITGAKACATGAVKTKISAEDCERLKSLGYMDPNTPCQ